MNNPYKNKPGCYEALCFERGKKQQLRELSEFFKLVVQASEQRDHSPFGAEHRAGEDSRCDLCIVFLKAKSLLGGMGPAMEIEVNDD